MLITASFAGKAEVLSARRLALMLLRFPLLTLKVIAGIHWEALKLLAKGMRFKARPAAPASPVTLVSPRFRP